MAHLSVARGKIIAVQEQRFRMVTDSGQGLLLTLHNRARVPADLRALQRAQIEVAVRYEGHPGLTDCVARRIDIG